MKTRILLLTAFSALWTLQSINAAPDPASAPARLKLPGESLTIDGRPAFILLPAEELRSSPQPWVMYAPTLPGYPDEHEKWLHEKLLAAGVAVAGVDADEAYGSPRGRKLMTALYEELTDQRDFAAKPCLLGRSRGGLWALSWAGANPDKVAGIAGIYPAFDLRMYPGLDKAASAYELTPAELTAQLAKHNPIEQVAMLAKARIPALFIHGEDDAVVPLKENSAEFVARYQAADAGQLVTLLAIEGQGHNFWPGYFRCQELVDFAIAQAKAGAKIKAGEPTSGEPEPRQ
jgi:dipeptidyl aminopeptidase/acylaminoacyl peptidase